MGISSFHTCVRKITIIWCTVSEVHSETDVMIPLLMIPKINIFKKWKKTLKILSFYTCTINEDHMIYGSSKIRRDRQFFVILGLFCPFAPLTTPNLKNQILKNWKKHLKILSFYTCAPESHDLWLPGYVVRRTRFVVILDHFLHFYPLTTPKIKILKKCKKT